MKFSSSGEVDEKGLPRRKASDGESYNVEILAVSGLEDRRDYGYKSIICSFQQFPLQHPTLSPRKGEPGERAKGEDFENTTTYQSSHNTPEMTPRKEKCIEIGREITVNPYLAEGYGYGYSYYQQGAYFPSTSPARRKRASGGESPEYRIVLDMVRSR